MKKVNLGVVAVVLGVAFAFGTQEATSKSVDQEYARLSNNTWIPVTAESEEQYACEESSGVCKATFPQDPNQSTSGMVITSNNGVYSLQ